MGGMTGGFQPSLDFDAATTAAEDGEALIIDVDGYEGPLHVLLALARTQKVDLLKLSVLKLAEQYLAFVQEAQRSYKPAAPVAYPLEDARERLRRLLPDLDRWTPLAGVAPLGTPTAGPSRASYLASTLSAGLELVKEGDLEARQLEAFADIY